MSFLKHDLVRHGSGCLCSDISLLLHCYIYARSTMSGIQLRKKAYYSEGMVCTASHSCAASIKPFQGVADRERYDVTLWGSRCV